MKKLTKKEIEALIAMSEEERETWIKKERYNIDFDATYAAISRQKDQAIGERNIDLLMQLGEVKAHLEMWDEQFH